MPILVFLGLSVLELCPMYVTDVSRRQTKASPDASALWGWRAGGIIMMMVVVVAVTVIVIVYLQKGTGKWTAIASLQFGIPVTLIGIVYTTLQKNQRHGCITTVSI